MLFVSNQILIHWLLAIVLFSSLCTRASAQSDPFAAHRIKKWLQQIDQGNFLEGTYSIPVSSPDIELISLLAAPIEPYTFGESRAYEIQYYSPLDTPYLVTVQEKRILSFYALESKSGDTRTGTGKLDSWKVDNLLDRLRISPQNLAIRIQLMSAELLYFLPAKVFHTETPPDVYPIRAHFRLGRSISGGEFRVFLGEEGEEAVKKGSIRKQLGGSILDLKIERECLGSFRGWVRVELVLRELGAVRKIPFIFYFYHRD